MRVTYSRELLAKEYLDTIGVENFIPMQYVPIKGKHPRHRELKPAMTRRCALEQTIVALGVEQPLFVESCLLELMVYIGGDDEIVLVFHEFEQVVIDRFRGRHIAVEIDMSAPVGPKLLLSRKVVEARRVHVGEAVFFDEIGEVFLEPLARIGKTRCC